jgi:PleD family two-component response regulator
MNQVSPYPLTVSVGVAKAAKGLKLENLLKEADAKLYQEKRR